MAEGRERNLELLVGSFVIGTMLLAGAWVLNNAWLQGAFTPMHHYTLELDDGVGLGVGTRVTIAGMEVGRVTDVALTPERRVRVAMEIESRHARHVLVDSVGNASLTLTGKVVTIGPGSPGAEPLADGGPLVSGTNFDILKTVEEMDLVQNIERIEAILGDLTDLAGRMNLGEGRVPEAVDALLSLVEDLQAGRGTVGRLLKDDATIEDINAALAAVDRMAGSIEGAAAALQQTTPGLDKAAGAVVVGAGSVEGASTALGRTATGIDGSLARLSTSLDRLDAGLGEMERTLRAIQELPVMRGAIRRSSVPGDGAE